MANANHPVSGGLSHEKIETSNFWMIVLILIVIAFGGLVEIVPLFFQKSTTQPVPGLKPYTALQLAGRDVYQREGCYNCHSQMIRPFRAETLRYGQYSVAGESVWDHPFQWGSKRTGPDLARVGGRYSDDWHAQHLHNPRDVVPESNMPAYPWLEKNLVDDKTIGAHMSTLRKLGVPYTDADISGAAAAVKGKTEQQAVIAYLQSLGHAMTAGNAAAAPAAAGAAAATAAVATTAAAATATAATTSAAPAAATASAGASATAAASAASQAAAGPADNEAAVKIENGVVQFFFATGKSEVAKGGKEALADVIAGVKAGKKAVISGYTDSTGDPVKNAELAKQRAFAVRDLLKANGVAENQIDLQKPADNNAGKGGQARRVDVALQ